MSGAWEIRKQTSVLGYTKEGWLPISSHASYSVSTRGRVKSLRRRVRRSDGVVITVAGRVLKPGSYKGGYLAVALYDGKGRSTFRYVHCLVLEAFVGPCPQGMECRHLDGDPTNNCLDNLCWGTPQENADDKTRHGTTIHGLLVGEKNGNSKATASVVKAIRRLHATGVKSRKLLVSRFGLSKATIDQIISRKTWTHV